jgi:hypothetical protein
LINAANTRAAMHSVNTQREFFHPFHLVNLMITRAQEVQTRCPAGRKADGGSMV